MLTFDLEEFDIPEEYGNLVSESEQFSITLSGMKEVILKVVRYPHRKLQKWRRPVRLQLLR